MPSYTLVALSGLLYDVLDGNNLLYPQAQVTGCLNNVVRKLNFLSGIIESTVQILTQANQSVYSRPAGVMIPTRVYCEGVELEKYSLQQLGTKYRNWATDTTAAYGPVARWCPVGTEKFILHPIDATGGKLLEVQGVAAIIPMVNPADTVDLEDEQVPILIDYLRGRIMLKLGGKPFASASVSYQRFIREVKDAVLWVNMKFPSYFIQTAAEGAQPKGS